MTIIDTDHSGTIDFHELAKGLQKIDLRVEVSAPHGYPLGPPPSDCLPLITSDGLPLDRAQVYEYMLVVMRLYSAEMARTAQLLRARFDQARADVATQAAKDIDLAKDPAAKVAAAKAATAIAELTANGQLPAEAVKTLLKQLDAPFAPVRLMTTDDD